MVASESSGGTDVSLVATLVVTGVVFAVVFALPLAVACVLWWVLRDRFSRTDFVVLGGLALVAGALSFVVSSASYFRWLASFFNGSFSVGATPWFAVLVWACVLVSVFGVVSGSRLTARLPKRMLSSSSSRKGKVSDVGLLPTESERSAASAVAVAPGAGLLSLAFADGKNASAPVGKRSFPIAVGKNGSPVMLSEDEIGTHMVLLGATGSGKTETIKALAASLLDLGWAGTIVDLKEDTKAGGLRDWLRDYASAHQVPWQQLCLSDRDSQTWFNPLQGLGPDEMRDLILQLQEFDDSYWQAINKELLGQVVNLMVWAHQADPSRFPAPSMYELGRVLGSGSLKDATKKMIATVEMSSLGVSKDDFGLLLSPPKDTQQSASGYAAKLNQVYETQAGRQVLRPSADEARVLLDVTAPGLCYIGLDMQAKPDLAKMISSAALQRMSVFAAARTTGLVTDSGGRIPRFIIVDEAGWVDRTIVNNLLARARAAGIALVLCTQGPKDWSDKQGDDWGKLTQNTNIAMFMRQGEPESAEICADFIGKEWQEVSSVMNRTAKGLLGSSAVRDASGRVVESESVRSEYLHLVDPDELRKLKKGDFVVRVGDPSRLEWGYVPMRDAHANPGRWSPARLQ